jgi:hypothetical protein
MCKKNCDWQLIYLTLFNIVTYFMHCCTESVDNLWSGHIIWLFLVSLAIPALGAGV